MKTFRLSLAAFAFLSMVSLSRAIVVTFTATLSGAQEFPPTGSPGTGSALLDWNTDSHELRVRATFSGLTGLTTASHVHASAPLGANAGVATTTPTFPGFPLGVTAGTYDATLNLLSASSFNAAYITAHGTLAQAESDLFAALNAGLAYFNIHTSTFGGGEIRGQLAPVAATVPDGGSTAQLLIPTILGLLGLHLRRRRDAQLKSSVR